MLKFWLSAFLAKLIVVIVMTTILVIMEIIVIKMGK